MTEVSESVTTIAVEESEYRRLLGFPRGHVPDDPLLNLSARARGWFAGRGRPWIYFREATVQTDHDTLTIDGVAFGSARLRKRYASAEVRQAMLVALSAGPESDAEARALWEAGRPDESYFVAVYGAAVAEQLVALVNSRVCALAAEHGWQALAHFSPGYTGWDVSEQTLLFDLITRDRTLRLPGPLEVLSSGMLRPKQSHLAVIGLAAEPVAGTRESLSSPCDGCGFHPCQFRRATYRHARAPRPAAVG